MKKIILGFLISLGMIAGTAQAITVFNSNQVGSNSTFGYVLQTNGATSTWVSTSTLGIVGGSGVSGGTLGFAAIFNSATSLTIGTLRDNGTVSGVNATSSTVSFNIQGSGNLNPFRVASSTGTALFTVAVNGSTTIGSLGTGVVQSSSGALFNGLVSLTSQVSGILPIANGGTGSSSMQSFALANLTLGSGLSFTSGDGVQVLIGTTTQISLTGSGSLPYGGQQGLFLGNTASGTAAWLTPLYVTVCSSGCNYTATGTNDQVGINAAITAVNAAGGGTVLIKAGTYSTTGAIYVLSNVTLRGEGDGTLLRMSSGANKGIMVNTATLAGVTNVTITELHLDGINQSSGGFNGDSVIATVNSSNVKIHHNTITNAKGFGIFLYAYNNSATSSSSSNIIVSDNYMQCMGLQDCIGGGKDDVLGSSSTSDFTISNNIIIQTSYAGGVQNSNMDVNCIDIVAVHRLIFTGNNCKGDVLFGNEQYPNMYSEITNNIIDSPLGPVSVSGEIAIEAAGGQTSAASATPASIIISGNIIKNGGIYIPGNGNNSFTKFLIQNNTIQTATSTAQHFRSAEHGIEASNLISSIISGNTITAFSGSTSKGISFSGTVTNNVVSNNTFTGFATGIDLASGSGNKDILNTFVSNTVNAANSPNTLTMTSGGAIGIATSTPGNALTVIGGISSSVLTNTFFPIAGTGGLLGNSSISQSGGVTLINGVTPIINAGGIWISDIVQASGANFIAQAPTSTAALGNVVFGGGVQSIAQTTYLTSTQFCTGGLFNAASSTALNIYLPTLAQIGLGLAPSTCTNSIYAGNWSPQFLINSGTANVTTNASGSGETLMYAPGSGAILSPGQSSFVVGQFTASSTILGATTTGMTLNTYLSNFQKRATNPTVQGQILIASTTGAVNEWVVGSLLAGTNITITTSTPGFITINSIGGASGFTIGSGTIYNATSTDLVGIGTTAPTSTLFVQGKSGTPAFTVASSTGLSVFSILSTGDALFKSATNSATAFQVQNSSGQTAFTISTISAYPFLAIGTSTNYSALFIQGTSTQATLPLFTVASSTGTSLFQVDSNGNLSSGGSIPTTSSGSVLTGSTNTRGRTIPAAAATTATITFANGGFGTTPYCTATQESGTAIVFTASATPTTLVLSGTTIGSDSFAWICFK